MENPLYILYMEVYLQMEDFQLPRVITEGKQILELLSGRRKKFFEQPINTALAPLSPTHDWLHHDSFNALHHLCDFPLCLLKWPEMNTNK